MTPRPLMVALTCLAAAQGQTPTFRSAIEAVGVDVLVTRDGRPVANLTPGDFDVVDNGVRQRVDYAWFDEIRSTSCSRSTQAAAWRGTAPNGCARSVTASSRS